MPDDICIKKKDENEYQKLRWISKPDTTLKNKAKTEVI